ncbi:MAG: hypothetical protein IJL76_00370 [Bacilli bacterium]|nr:hypothetical protein [Bacilli bacterium]
MKRYIKILFVFVIAFLLTGCMKAEFTMTINKDKSMDLGIIYAFDDSLMEQGQSSSTNFDEQSKELKKKGFSVTGYKKDGKTGIEATKRFKNIDEMSSSDSNSKIDLNSYMENKKDKNGFKVKKGLFKNHYYATVEVDTSTTNTTTNNRQYREEDNNSNGDADYSSLMSNMDLSFNVILPFKAIKSNATSTEDNGKKLKWDLTKVKEDMTFEFALYNYRNIYIAGGVLLVIILLIVSSIMTRNKEAKPTISKDLNNVHNTSNDMETTIIDGDGKEKEFIKEEVDNSNDDPFSVPTDQVEDNQEVDNPVPKQTESSTENSDALNDLYNN